MGLLFLLGLTACPSTRYVSTWKGPSAEPLNWRGKKVAAFVLSVDESVRRGAEGSLARELTSRGAQGMAGYELVPMEVIRSENKEKAKEILQKAGVEGAVLMRLVGSENKVYSTQGATWVSGGYYPTFWGYWGYGWNVVYTPGTLTTEKVVSIETLVYSVSRDELVWAGLSETTDPKGVPKLIEDLVKAAGKELRKEGLVSR